MGMDGAADDEEEIERQVMSEYDHFRAITSPGTPVQLGKRARKSVMDLSMAMDTTTDESEDY